MHTSLSRRQLRDYADSNRLKGHVAYSGAQTGPPVPGSIMRIVKCLGGTTLCICPVHDEAGHTAASSSSRMPWLVASEAPLEENQHNVP